MALAIPSRAARADIIGPYAPDAATLHLWHLDEFGPPAADAGLTNLPLGALANGATLGNESFPGFGNALSTLDTGQNGTGATDKDAYLAPVELVNNSAADNIAWSFADPVTGAFTFEAMVRIDFDPALNQGATAVGGNNRNAPLQILTGEQDGSGGGTRSWQFRLDPVGFNPNAGGLTTPLTQPALEFINLGAPTQWIFAMIPTNGPDAIVSNQWYHVAVTYDGNAGAPDNLKVYWTLVDAGRTQANLLVSATMTNDLPVGFVDFALGNTGRGTPNGSLLGAMDEVRISSVARPADQMLFGVSRVPPAIQTQPRSQFVAAGDTVVFTALASGSPPLSYQWQFNEQDLTGETSTILTLPNVTPAAAGDYRLIVANAAGSATSEVARLTVGAGVGDLYGTGTDDGHVLLPASSRDPHFALVASDDLAFPGPVTLVLLEATPIPPYAANGPRSKWIGPRLNSGAAPIAPGTYVYRHEFALDTVNPSATVLRGAWGSDNDGLDIRLNGVSLGISRPIVRAFETLGPFTLSNGLVAGLNTLDFVISNRPPADYSAFRADLSGVGLPRSAGPPEITVQPANRTFAETDMATLSVVALGTPPLAYQWYRDGVPVPGQTRRTLRFMNAMLSMSGDYRVVVSNDSGSVTSEVATLTVKVNDPPVANPDGVVTAVGQAVTFGVARLLANDTDPEGQVLRFVGADGSSALGGTITLTNRSLLYTPPGIAFPEDVDTFNYTINDGFGGTAVGSVEVRLMAPPVPGENQVLIAPASGGYRLRYFGDSLRSYQIQRAPAVTGPYSPLQTVTTTFHGWVEYLDTAPLPGMAFYGVAAP
jgi:hypothetical protein